MTNQNPTRIVTGEVRLSYANVWEPNFIQGGKPRYSVSLIIPKSDTATITAIEKAVDAAIEQGIGKFGLRLVLLTLREAGACACGE